VEYNLALQNNLIRKNEEGRLVNVSTGRELPTMFGRGGMRILVGAAPTSTVSNITSSACNITIEPYAKLGGNSVLRTHVDFVTGERFEEIVEVDVEEKRRREELLGGNKKIARQKRTHPPPVTIEDVPDLEMIDETLGRTPAPSAEPVPSTGPELTPNRKEPPKYRLASDLSQKIGILRLERKLWMHLFNFQCVRSLQSQVKSPAISTIRLASSVFPLRINRQQISKSW